MWPSLRTLPPPFDSRDRLSDLAELDTHIGKKEHISRTKENGNAPKVRQYFFTRSDGIRTSIDQFPPLFKFMKANVTPEGIMNVDEHYHIKELKHLSFPFQVSFSFNRAESAWSRWRISAPLSGSLSWSSGVSSSPPEWSCATLPRWDLTPKDRLLIKDFRKPLTTLFSRLKSAT